MNILVETNTLSDEISKILKEAVGDETSSKIQHAQDSNKEKVDNSNIVPYIGQFQPFHAGHAKIYFDMVDLFGKESVYITVAPPLNRPNVQEVQEGDDANEKLWISEEHLNNIKDVASEVFSIPADHVVPSNHPLIPVEILGSVTPTTTSWVEVVSKREAAVLAKNKYFRQYSSGMKLKPMSKEGYYIIVPPEKLNIGSMDITDQQAMDILQSGNASKDLELELVKGLMRGKGGDRGLQLALKSVNSLSGEEDGLGNSDGTGRDGDGSGKQKKSSTRRPGDTKSGTKKSDSSGKDISITDKIINPDTGRAIKVQSALKYPRWKPAYKKAQKLMKKAGLDRQDRVDKPKIEKKYAQWEKRDNSNSANENQKKNLNKNSELIPELVQNILNLGESDLGKLFQIMGMVSEGGAAGHMPHPYEDKSLTFADMRELIRRGTSGGLDAEAPVSEKIDGANINFSYRDGKILFARSKGQFKNRGANALDRDALFSKYEGSERAQAFFTRAADELSKSIGDLSTDEISSMFGNGSTWVNVEIVGSDSKNVIPYNKNVLVFHNSVTFDEEGTPQSTDMNAGHVLAKKIIQSHQSDPGATYGVQGPQIVAFSDKDDSKYLEYQKEFNEAVNLIQKTSGMSDDSTIGDMLAKKWQGFIKKTLPEGAHMSPEMVSALGRRWGAGEKTGGSGIGAREFKKAHPELTDWFASTEKISHTVNKKMIRPIELLYLKLGAVSLMRVSNFMESNNPSASAEIKEGIVQVLKAMRENPGQASDEMVAEMDRLESVGFDKLVPSEGVVFTYKGNLYKFTGSFAPLNQLLGALRYKPEQLGLPPRPVDGGMGGESIPKPIVIYPGRFQPFHPGHKSLYDKLVDAYGEENVYIATSNKMDNKESPLSFEEKKTIMTKLFGINPNNIVQTTSPYTPSEILQNISPDTPVIMAVSSKDSDKISRSGFFKRLPPNPTDIRGHGVARYYDVLPELHQDIDSGANMSGSSIRSALANPNLDSIEKKKAFQNIFGKYDPEIFSIMANGFGRLKTSSVPQLTSRRPSDTEAPPIAPKRARPKATGPLRLRKKSEPAMEEPPPQQDRPEPISTSSRLAAAPRKPRQPDAGNEGEEDFLRSLGIDPKARVKNPETDNDILITTALGYDKNHPARKNADTYIRAHSKK